jgi:hypothetical protein
MIALRVRGGFPSLTGVTVSDYFGRVSLPNHPNCIFIELIAIIAIGLQVPRSSVKSGATAAQDS